MEQEAMTTGAGDVRTSFQANDRHGCEPIAILLLALALNLAGNRGTGLWDRDEPRYARLRP